MLRSQHTPVSVNLVSAKTHYAVMAMVELAEKADRGESVSLRHIADRHGIPLPFLTQIFQQLRGAGLVTSTRGANGGFRIGRAASEMRLSEIVRAVSPRFESSVENYPTEEHTAVAEVWQNIDRWVQSYLDSLTLHDLVEHAQGLTTPMFYI